MKTLMDELHTIVESAVKRHSPFASNDAIALAVHRIMRDIAWKMWIQFGPEGYHYERE